MPGSSRVLVVDDDIDFAQSLAAVLEEAGHEVRVACSASEGLRFLNVFVPDVAIADIRMPIVDGYALLAILRADPKLGACKFIAISGDRVEEGRAASEFDAFFTKPVEMGRLIDAVQERGTARELH